MENGKRHGKTGNAQGMGGKRSGVWDWKGKCGLQQQRDAELLEQLP